MRHLLNLIFFLAFLLGHSQEDKSLLWEISGNGLEKTSYLYGTMHVSKKIAFRLDDVFYEALDKSEIIALESDPGFWLEDREPAGMGNYGQSSGFVNKGFYAQSFRVENPRKELIGAFLAYEDRIVNNILYRTNAFSQNLEEDTYLDMFIYQAGKKFDKPIVALEDIEESVTLVGRASLNAMKQKPDEWLQKKMQQSDPMFLLQDAYRERNIALLDSIDRAMHTDHYLKNMLFIRNGNMVESLDSVMKNGKVFAGIGAAHLPGDQGVIDLLQKKGYTVKPLLSKSSSKGQNLKHKFEEKIRENKYQIMSPEDGFFTIALSNKLYPVSDMGKTTYVSPDLANGSFVVINRIPTYSFLKQDAVVSLKDIDQLLFENIPGKILEKNFIEKDGFKGLDIKNQLKNGDQQRYHIFKTPLEIIIIKMGGEGDYVAQYSDRIFKSLAFKERTGGKVVVSPSSKDFEVQMPPLYSFTNQGRTGDRWIEGYDRSKDVYYFLRKSVLNDFNFIEVDTFELKQIHKRFYQDLELTPDYSDFKGNKLFSSALMDSISQKELHLMATFRGGEYYLLGVISKNKKNADSYFDSFRLRQATYKETFKKVVDTALHFSTMTTIKPPKFVESSTGYFSDAPKTKPYDPYYKKTIYRTKNDEAITVELNKSHDFLMFRNLDSVWALRKKLYAHKNFNIVNEKATTSAQGHHELQLVLTDTGSTRGILVKNVLNNGLLYELKTVVDTLEKPSQFVTEFFDHFQLTDTVIGTDILKDKVSDFFTALRKKDSIVLDGYRYLKFDKKHADSIQYYISKFEFDPSQRQIQTYLIQQLGEMNLDFTEFYKDFYTKSYNNSQAQAMILQAISEKLDESSVKLLLELMETDLPLLSNTFQISLIFSPYYENLSVAKQLFPKLLDYSTIPEYKAPIFSLLAKLESTGTLKSKTFKRYKTQMLTDAKIYLKRQMGRDLSNGKQDIRSSTNPRTDIGILEDYVSLLYPFKSEKTVQQFFTQLQAIEEPKIQATYLSLLAKTNKSIPQKKLVELASDINGRISLFNKLKAVEKLGLFPEKYRSQKFLAEATLFKGATYNDQKEDVAFVTSKPLNYEGKELTGYYFKKRNKEEYGTNYNMHLLVFENEKGLQTTSFYENEGLRIEDTDTEAEVIDYVTEAFLLKDRPRAEVYRPHVYGAYGFHGY